MLRLNNLKKSRHIAQHSTREGGRPWTKLLRFLDGSCKEQWGEPCDCTEFHQAKLVVNGIVTEKVVDITSVLSPVIPTNIIGIGLNYRKHAGEIHHEVPRYPIVFQKNVSSMTSHNKNIVIPKIARGKVDFEAELAVVIGKECKNVDKENALSFVLGYTCANDVTARIWQDSKRGGTQWCFGKSFDTFCPLGPLLVSPTLVPNPNGLQITCSLNGDILQNSSTVDMIFSVAELISFLSQDTTLSPGTVILTGTPEGVGFTRDPPIYLRSGDIISVEIENVGILTNQVIE